MLKAIQDVGLHSGKQTPDPVLLTTSPVSGPLVTYFKEMLYSQIKSITTCWEMGGKVVHESPMSVSIHGDTATALFSSDEGRALQ